MDIQGLKAKAQTSMANAAAQEGFKIFDSNTQGTFLCFSNPSQAGAVYDYLLALSVTPPYDADKQGYTPVQMLNPCNSSADTFYLVHIDHAGLMPGDVFFSTYQDGRASPDFLVENAQHQFAKWAGADTPFPAEVTSSRPEDLQRIDHALAGFARAKFLEASGLPKPAAHMISPDMASIVAHLSPASAPLALDSNRTYSWQLTGTGRMSASNAKADLQTLKASAPQPPVPAKGPAY